jgi:hypothetical protein
MKGKESQTDLPAEEEFAARLRVKTSRIYTHADELHTIRYGGTAS